MSPEQNCLTLFLHPAEEYAVIDALRTSPEVSGFTLTRCEGHSATVSVEGNSSAIDQVVGFVPRMRLEVIVAGSAVESIIERIRAGLGPDSGGHFVVTPVLQGGSLSKGQH